MLGFVCLYALFVEPRWVEVTHTRVGIKDLGPGLEGVRIALVSDVHRGPWTGRGFIEAAADRINAERPDILALAGDFVHHSDKYAEDAVAPFGKVRAPLGKFAVLGNHDHWEGADTVRAALRRHGIELLENRHRIVSRNGASLCIAGVEEYWEGHPDAAAALRGVDDAIPRILMVHNPDYVNEIPVPVRIDLALAGHTHGGQVILPFFGPLLVPVHGAFVSGLQQTARARIYVTRGLSEIAPPLRFRCRPEISMMVLSGR